MLKQLLMSKHNSILKSNKHPIFNKDSRFNKKHGAFAISIEILVTLIMFTQITAFTFYSMRVMNGQRYLQTILYHVKKEALFCPAPAGINHSREVGAALPELSTDTASRRPTREGRAQLIGSNLFCNTN